MQKKERQCLLFSVHRVQVRRFVMQVKASGSCSPLKPTPMQEADLRHCSESARCGGVTVLYGRIIAYMKHLHGVRNTVFPEWKWGSIRMTVTKFYCAETGREEVCTTRACMHMLCHE